MAILEPLSQAETIEFRSGKPSATEPAWRSIDGYTMGEQSRKVSRLAAAVESHLPHREYQSELEPFRDVLNSVIRCNVQHRSATTERGTKRWLEIVGIQPEAPIYADVSGCNHVPIDIRGYQDVDVGTETVRIHWEAWLSSVERIDEGDPKRPIRTVAGFRVALGVEERAPC